ncbi:annexin [Flavobacterium fluviatile]|uniref:annexin n=1 Tax=Flavobacterium fluviatile TaxID=1862387 RepID=UPI0013D16294|nr:annexin [Flavobacterium fluviatile]
MKISDSDKKNIKIGLGVVAGGLLLYFIFRNKTEKYDPTGNPDYIPAQPVFNAKNIAENLYEAMKDIGTEEDAILETLKTVTQSQFAQVVEAFGKKEYNSWTGNQVGFGLTKEPLKVWLKEELSVKDYAILKMKYPYSL